jgi:Sec-independent protein translocase protein TatA
MDIREFDEQLNTIKAFHTYLSEVIDKGYNNNPNIVKLIVKTINEYIENMSDVENDNQDNEETEEEEENEDMEFEKKIQLKIDKFMSSNNDLSKIYLYQKEKKYITEMNEFINNSFIY